MARSIFKENKKYTFSDYFELNIPVDEIITELGYSFRLKEINIPFKTEIKPEVIERLQNSYYELLPKITLNSEIAKREFMIAPVLYEVIRDIEAKLNIEYPIYIDEKLSGFIDYLIKSKQQVIIIEAKRGNLDKGFNQLAAELIALDKYEDINTSNTLYGAITIGEVWIFALLNKKNKQIIKDIHTFRYPEDIKDIFNKLRGMLEY